MRKSLTRVQAGAALDATMAVLKNKVNAELKADNLKDISASVKNAVGAKNIDLESFDVVSVGYTKTASYNTNAEIVGGSQITGYNLGEGSRALESFDTLDTSNDEEIKMAAINIVSANMDIAVDGIVGLCSVATVDGSSSGLDINVSTPMVLVGSEVINGVSVGGVKTSLLPNINDKAIFGNQKTKLLPILRTTGDVVTSDQMLTVAELISSTTYKGETISTSPIAVGTGINLRKLCNTNRYIAEYGTVTNFSETLSREGSLKNVYVKITNPGATITNYLKLKTTGLDLSSFAEVGAGKGKDLAINFKATMKIAVATAGTEGTLILPTGNTTLLGAGTVTYVIGFNVNVTVNTDTMLMDIMGSKPTIQSVLVNGAAVATNASEYTAATALFATASIVGIDMNQFLSNTNNLTRGIIIDVDVDPYLFPLSHKAPVTLSKSIFAESNSEAIAGYLGCAKVGLSAMKSEEIYETVVSVVDGLKGKADANGFISSEVRPAGIGYKFCKPMIITDTLDASKTVTQKSGETSNDVANYMLDNLVAGAAKLFSFSNLDKTVAAIAPGEEITLSIVTDSRTASYLVQAQSKDPRFKVEVHTTAKFTDRVVATFKIGDKVCEVSPVILVQSPDFIYKGIETTGGGTAAVTKMIPRNGIFVNNILFLVYTVTGIKEAFKR